MKAMLFAAGLGTRLQPFTNHHPKALAVVNGKTLLERNITYLKDVGCTEIVVNVHHFADQIIDFLTVNNHFGIDIVISDETGEVLETGGGLMNAKHHFTDDFIVMNVDILTNLNLRDLLDDHFKNSALVTLAVSDRHSSRKLLFQEDLSLKGWRNLQTGEEILANTALKDLKELAFSGIHVIRPALFDLVKSTGKFSIMEVYMDLMKTEQIRGYDHSGSTLIDVGRAESILEAENYFI